MTVCGTDTDGTCGDDIETQLQQLLTVHTITPSQLHEMFLMDASSLYGHKCVDSPVLHTFGLFSVPFGLYPLAPIF